MIKRYRMAAACIALLGVVQAGHARDLKIGIVFDPDDPRYDSRRLDKLYPSQATGRPQAGAELALAESGFQLDQAKLRVTFEEVREAFPCRPARKHIG